MTFKTSFHKQIFSDIIRLFFYTGFYMSTIQIILLSLSAIIVVSYTLCIVGLSKKIPLMEKIAKPFILPCLLAVSLIILTSYFPDSRNIIRHAVPAIFLGLTGIILFDYIENIRFSKIFKTISQFMFIIQKIFWIMLLYRSIQLYPRVTSFNVFIIILYISVGALLFFIRLFPEKIWTTLLFIINTTTAFFLNYITIITLEGFFCVYSIFFLLGSISLIFADYLIMIEFCEKKIEWNNLLKDIFFFASQILMALGAISMMIF